MHQSLTWSIPSEHEETFAGTWTRRVLAGVVGIWFVLYVSVAWINRFAPGGTSFDLILAELPLFGFGILAIFALVVTSAVTRRWNLFVLLPGSIVALLGAVDYLLILIEFPPWW